ncbi:GtrA family protein [Halomicrococcus sp. NG-SE-24]|uniref:GtrA family protein n=1 Tax=Halomicrococcus sp. NG-SE-24 TaxID=3436928 RepID=UPI003D985A06
MDTSGALATRDRLARLARFATVGVSGFVVNLLVFAVTTPALQYVLAGVISWAVANFSSYNLNRRFTFSDVEYGYLRGYLRHLSVYVVGFAVYVVALSLLGLFVDRFLALAVAVTLSGALNFVGSEFWVFDPGL